MLMVLCLHSGPSEWDYINGGCYEKCGEKLDCGHLCSLKCHSFPHSRVVCDSVCNKRLECGHKCRSLCSSQHSCSCTSCQVDLETSYAAATAAAAAELNVPVEPKADPRPEGIRAYQAYASGGVKEHDAILFEKARASKMPSAPDTDLCTAMEDLMVMDDEQGGGGGKDQAGEKRVKATPRRMSVSLLDLYDE